jgi:hypothetical protein
LRAVLSITERTGKPVFEGVGDWDGVADTVLLGVSSCVLVLLKDCVGVKDADWDDVAERVRVCDGERVRT